MSNIPDPAVLATLYGTSEQAQAAALTVTLRALQARRDSINVLIAMLEGERAMRSNEPPVTS